MAHKTIWLIRHGKTAGNAGHKYIGRKTDEPLSEEGISGAMAKRDELKKRNPKMPDRLVSSPMIRAVSTAEILFGDLPMACIDELSEMDFGIFEGKSYLQLTDDALYRAWTDTLCREKIPEGESLAEFCKRSLAGFQRALGGEQNETIAIVCHGGTIMAVMSTLTGEDYFDFRADNLGGYCIDLEMDDAGIHDITYTSLWPWDPSGSDHR
ncbi:MAG: histidine phosphatase family protein [Lachnospiraceae bacterium]|nr:histidine phosphatase family protein [Lachnospiraceae bacterium]